MQFALKLCNWVDVWKDVNSITRNAIALENIFTFTYQVAVHKGCNVWFDSWIRHIVFLREWDAESDVGSFRTDHNPTTEDRRIYKLKKENQKF
jgi:hypothetical protein